MMDINSRLAMLAYELEAEQNNNVVTEKKECPYYEAEEQEEKDITELKQLFSR